MIRKLTLLFLLCIGLHSTGRAQIVYDSVTIYLPPYTDTTCPGDQLDFFAVQSNDTFSPVSYRWYTNSVYTGVSIDTFSTTALANGDSVYCVLYYRRSDGMGGSVLDSFRSNVIYIYRSSPLIPRVIVSLTSGSNPDCAGHPLTFTAYPIHGGPLPRYQWLVNDTAVSGADSSTYTNIFRDGDTVSCLIISNSPCRVVGSDSAYSNGIPVVHIRLTAGITIAATLNPICEGRADTFTATLVNASTGYTITWYVDSTVVPTAITETYITDSLRNGSRVYAILATTDSCIINDTTISNIITMTVVPLNVTTSVISLYRGSNPGCYDSLLGLKGTIRNFGTSPVYAWYINGVIASTDTILETFFDDGDVVTFKAYATDGGCYTQDTVVSAPYLVLRDSTPPTPLISLIGNLLVANEAGRYSWYGPSGLIAGSVSQTHHPATLGYYYAIRDSGNCPSDTSNIIYISLLKVDNMTQADVKVYPNPTSGLLIVDRNEVYGEMKLDVYNIMGQGLLHEDIGASKHFETDLSYLPEGNYLVVLRHSDGTSSTFKVMLTK